MAWEKNGVCWAAIRAGPFPVDDIAEKKRGSGWEASLEFWHQMARESKNVASARGKRKRRRIYLLDDHPMIRYGMAELINGEPDLMVCGEASNAYDAIDELSKAKADLVVVDITLQGKSGLEFIKETQRLQTPLDTLVVSMHDEGFYAERVLRAGGRGYLMKLAGADELLKAIRVVLGGEVYVSARISKLVFDQLTGRANPKEAGIVSRLTDKEVEVLSLIGQAKESRDIAKQLNMSLKTVEAHRTHIRQKLEIGSRAELIQFAVRWTMGDDLGRGET